MKTKDKARFNIVLVSGVIFKSDKVLIAQRSFDEVQAPGKWSIPGGKVDVNNVHKNILEDTLRREVEEEVGIQIEENMDYVISSSFIRIDKSPVVTILFKCIWKSGKAKPLDDSIAVKWIDRKETRSYDLADGVENAIDLCFIK